VSISRQKIRLPGETGAAIFAAPAGCFARNDGRVHEDISYRNSLRPSAVWLVGAVVVIVATGTSGEAGVLARRMTTAYARQRSAGKPGPTAEIMQTAVFPRTEFDVSSESGKSQ
jgi:hypothetical protein